MFRNKLKGEYRKKVAGGVVSVAKMPWNVVRMVTFSLEKISDVTRSAPSMVMERKFDKNIRK